jgi:LysM repeat protein
MSRPLAALIVLPLLGAAGLPHAQGICTDTYTVVRGDTLYSIARLCRSSVRAMARANRLASPAGIEVGQRLVVPGRRSASVRTFHEEVKPAPRAAAAAAPQRGGYRIERGDTLYSLARWAGVSLRALLAANAGIEPAKIEIGDLIRLPAGARDPAPIRARERGRRAPAPVSREPATAEDDEDKPADDEPDPAGM